MTKSFCVVFKHARHTLRAFACCYALSLMGCSTKIPIEAFVPPTSIAAAQQRQIAVEPFDGPQGEDLAREIESRLAAVRIKGQPYFSIVGPDEAKAYYIGTVEQPSVNSRDTQESRPRQCAQYNNRGRCVQWNEAFSVSCQRIDGAFVFTPYLIETATGRTVYSRRVEGTSSDSGCEDTSWPSEDKVLATAKEQALKKFLTQVAPSTKVVDIEIMDSFDNVSDDATRKRLDQGFEFAKERKLDQACKIWRESESNASKSMELTYNIGFCFEIEGDYARAEEYYRRATQMRLLYKPAGLTTGTDRVLRDAVSRAVDQQKAFILISESSNTAKPAPSRRARQR